MHQGSQLFLNLFNNLAVFIVCIFIYGLLYRIHMKSPWARQLLMGLLFGVVVLACMVVRLRVAEGVVVDQRNAIIVLSTLFGGPLSGLITVGFAAAMRISIGGLGVLSGLTGIVLSFVAGMALRRWDSRDRNAVFFVTGALFATLLILPGFLLYDNLVTGWALLQRMLLPYGLAIFFGITLGGMLLQREQNRIDGEQQLTASEKKFRQLYESLVDIGFEIDLNGEIQIISPSIQTIAGYHPDELIGQSITNYYQAPDDYRRLLHEIVQHQRVENFEVRFLHKHGESIWLSINGSLVLDKQGEAIGVRGLARDITKIKQAEQALAEEAVRRRILIDQSRDGIVVIDQDGKVYEANKKFAEMLDYTAEEILQLHVWDWETQSTREQIVDMIRSVDTTGHHFETRHRRKDGSIFDVELSNNGVVYGGQKLIFCVCRDITERKQAEQELRDSEARFKALHNASFGGIAIHDQGIIVECNQGLAEITGYAVAELIGMDGLLLIAEQSRNTVRQNILAGYEKPYEVRGLRKDGTEFPARLEARNIPYKGKPVRSAEFRDITELKRGEEEREMLRAQLYQAQKLESVGRLAGGVAHDFNNMLGVILGHVELAMEEIEPSHSLFPDLTQIKNAAERSANLTKQLLAFARRQAISPKVLDLNETVEGMLAMLRRLIGEDIDLACLPAKGLWPVKVDPSQIDQILANLCVNARDAIAGVGKVTIETGNTSFDQDYCAQHPEFVQGDFVMLAISDNGCGMDQETQERIFEPFFTTKSVGEGTGLGLSTVYGVVKQNNGFINIYSEPDQGTTFKIYFPRAEGQETEKPSASIEKRDLRGNETVLLVEDEESLLALGETILEQNGYEVLAAQSPNEALRMIHHYSGPIHLLITDVVMPEMNGKVLRDNVAELKPDLKSIFMSGYTANIIAHHGILEEGIDFLQKPFSVMTLLEKVRDVLDR